MGSAATSQAFDPPTRLGSRRFVTLIAIMGLGVAGWLPVVNFLSLFIRDDLGRGVAGAGVLLVAMHGARAVLGIFASVPIARFGSQRTYALGLAGLCVLVAVMIFTPDLGLFIVAAPFGGLALGLHWSASQTYAMQVAPAARRGLASSLVSFTVGVAPGLGGLALGVLANAFGFRVFALVAAVTIGAAALAALTVLPAVPAAPRASKVKLSELLQLTRVPAIRILAFIRACTTVTYGAFIILAGPKLVDAGGDLTAVGWLVFLSAVGGASAQVAVGALSDRWGRRGALAVALAVGAVNTAVYGQIDAFGALLALWVPYAFTQSVFQGLIVALAADVTPHGRLGQAMAIDSTAYSIGVAIAALLAIAAGDAAPALLFWAGAAAGVASLVAISRLRVRGAVQS